MLKGLYQAASGMVARLAAQDTIANNLANANTAGFQRAITGIRLTSLPQRPGATRAGSSPEVLSPSTTTDTRPGLLEKTGNDSDVALEGGAYLVAQTKAGQQLVAGGPTRLTPKGELAGPSGDPLVGTDGKSINVAGKVYEIATDGTVRSKGQVLGKLKVVRAMGPVEHQGNSLVTAPGVQDAAAGSYRVLQGYLQHSNVEPVREMVDMIAGMRAYEASQKAVAAQDQSMQNLLDVLRQH